MKKKSIFIVMITTLSLLVAHGTVGASSFWFHYQPQTPASLQKE